MQRSSPRASAGLSMLRGVDGALGAAGAHQRVQLVDEQDVSPRRLVDLASGAALSRSSNSPRYLVPATSAPRSRATSCLFFRPSGHVAVDDALGEALDDRGLAHARLADEHRVVLGAARTAPGSTRRISSSRPMTGSSLPRRAWP